MITNEEIHERLNALAYNISAMERDKKRLMQENKHLRNERVIWANIARMNAILIEVEAMQWANVERITRNEALAYPETMFTDAADELKRLAAAFEHNPTTT